MGVKQSRKNKKIEIPKIDVTIIVNNVPITLIVVEETATLVEAREQITLAREEFPDELPEYYHFVHKNEARIQKLHETRYKISSVAGPESRLLLHPKQTPKRWSNSEEHDAKEHKAKLGQQIDVKDIKINIPSNKLDINDVNVEEIASKTIESNMKNDLSNTKLDWVIVETDIDDKLLELV